MRRKCPCHDHRSLEEKRNRTSSDHEEVFTDDERRTLCLQVITCLHLPGI